MSKRMRRKPLWYKIEDEDDFMCPICGHQLYLYECNVTQMHYKGRGDEVLNVKELKCVNCGIDFSNQLIFDFDSGHYKFANKETIDEIEGDE